MSTRPPKSRGPSAATPGRPTRPRATRTSLATDLRAIGLEPGDAVLVHAALRAIGPIVGGADVVVTALRDVVGQAGTILGYTDWQSEDEILDDPSVRNDIPAFDPLTSRATRDNGFFPDYQPRLNQLLDRLLAPEEPEVDRLQYEHRAKARRVGGPDAVEPQRGRR